MKVSARLHDRQTETSIRHAIIIIACVVCYPSLVHSDEFDTIHLHASQAASDTRTGIQAQLVIEGEIQCPDGVRLEIGLRPEEAKNYLIWAPATVKDRRFRVAFLPPWSDCPPARYVVEAWMTRKRQDPKVLEALLEREREVHGRNSQIDANHFSVAVVTLSSPLPNVSEPDDPSRWKLIAALAEIDAAIAEFGPRDLSSGHDDPRFARTRTESLKYWCVRLKTIREGIAALPAEGPGEAEREAAKILIDLAETMENFIAPPPNGGVVRWDLPVDDWRKRLEPALTELKKGR